MRRIFLAVIFVFVFVLVVPRAARKPASEATPGLMTLKKVTIGMTRLELLKLWPQALERTYRVDGQAEWLTFDYRDENDAKGCVTFWLQNNEVVNWKLNDREEIVEEYLSEFSPLILATDYTKIYAAIRNVLKKLPNDVFLSVTERSYPAVFTEYYYRGKGRLANSTDVWNLPGDPPAFARGFYLIKLSTELNDLAKDESEIEAVIAHELAHQFLNHGAMAASLKNEVGANRLIKQWGFEEEFSKAKKRFTK